MFRSIQARVTWEIHIFANENKAMIAISMLYVIATSLEICSPHEVNLLYLINYGFAFAMTEHVYGDHVH